MPVMHSVTVFKIKFEDGSEQQHTTLAGFEAAHNSGRKVKSSTQTTRRVLCAGRACHLCGK